MPPLRLSVDELRKLLTSAQMVEMGFPSKGEIELSKLEENTWMLSALSGQKDLNENAAAPFSPLHQKVLRLLKTHRLPDLIEGKFEQFLSSEELKAFRELVERQKVVVVKSNPKFDKGIYREAMSPEQQAANRAPHSTTPRAEIKKVTHTMVEEKPVEEYSLLQDGFMILRSDGAAKAASFDLADRIRAGEIKGIKSFDGFYYIIENALLEKFTSSLLSALKEKKKEELPALALSQAVPPLLARIVLEFAKEDGLVIEKQKNLFAYVG